MYFGYDFCQLQRESAGIGTKSKIIKEGWIRASEERRRESNAGAVVLELHPCFLA